jgi:phosphopantothenoylcysteine decarboxylase/phosphopantothenate--cysteine ligase
MNILLAVTGSIAAYKSFDLTRTLVKAGHKVRVVLTQGALEFVKPELFRYLGAEATYLPTDDFNSPTPGVPHVELGKWAEKLVIAPLSANTLSKISQGEAGDFLTSIFMAWRQNRPVLMFPAMNTMMWEHAFTQEHAKKINKLPYAKVIDPAAGLLVCGDEGAGKLMDVDAIRYLIETYNPLLSNEKKVLITTGATLAPMDPVRYITNPSSGLTGIEMARAYLTQGCQVTLLTGSNELPLADLRAHPNCQVFYTPRTQQMFELAQSHQATADTVITAAAVADFEFDESAHKVKKEGLDQLRLKKATDILAELLKTKKSHQKYVSFAAETETTEAVFREKFNRKPVDLMIGNAVHSGISASSAPVGFKAAQGTYWFIKKEKTDGPQELTKVQLAHKVASWDLTGELL